MAAIHKILVEKETGKIITPVYLIENERPAPPDCVWHTIEEGTWLYKHFSMDPPEDISHLSIEETFWDFEAEEWIEVPTASIPTFENTKRNRNELLKLSDRVFSTITDPVEVARWTTYRQQLRDAFVDLPVDFDWNMFVFPRTPTDIDELKRKAAEGDTEAAKIVKKDKL